jgi:hypothetical protein
MNHGFKPERNPTTGACVAWDSLVGKFAVVDCRGHEVAYKRSLEAARELAASLPGEPYQPPEPRPVNISPRADATLRAQLGAPPVAEPEGPRADEGAWPRKQLRVISRRGVYGVGERPPR